MSTDAKTLDDLLRKRATEQLRSDVRGRVEQVKQLTGYDTLRLEMDPRYVQIEEEHVRILRPHELLDAMAKAVIEKHAEARGNREVKDFLERVDSIGDEIRDLREAVSE